MREVLLTVILAPLIGALIAGFFGHRIGRRGAHTVTIAGVAAACVASFYTLKRLALDGDPAIEMSLYTWALSEGVRFEIGFLVDRLTALMMVVVTFVSLMVHIYTIGYMAHDEENWPDDSRVRKHGYQRFFSYIALFTFSMLMLVMSNNFLQLFFGWEAVGLVSYLLIGFYMTRESAIRANLKAFLVNRVGDFGFLLGIAAIYYYFGSLDYRTVFAAAPGLGDATIQVFGASSWSVMTLIGILLFIGAMGKSAQMPLHVWLPDSMEGPTPISALIHAATMVTAGVFMVARMSPLYELSETALSFVLVMGGLTAFMMGLVGIVQNDIKRVVAYSTLSQLGYMTVALGVSAYAGAIFHLMTHAFFKALLFLAAGSVIIAMHHDQDIRNMGGLRKYMPITYWTSLIGSLALIGTPGFAGFFSKDAIIEAVHHSSLPGAGLVYWLVLGGLFVTAFYSFRMFFLVFHGEPRMDAHTREHLRESPAVVTIPLILLGIASLASGFLLAWNGAIEKWLEPVVGFQHPEPPIPIPVISGATLALVILGAVLAYQQYRREVPLTAPTSVSPLTVAARKDLYGDAFNEAVFMRPGQYLTRALVWFDNRSIDGAVVAMGSATAGLSNRLRKWQTGYSRSYALSMLAGAFLLFVALLVVRL